MKESRWTGRLLLIGGLLAVIIVVLIVTGAFGGGDDSSGGNAASQGGASGDRLVVAIPATPQGIDLDVDSGLPVVWQIAAQVMDPGLDWKRIPYPYEPHAGIDNTKVPGFTYPAMKEGEIEPGLLTSCDLEDGGRTGVYHIREGVKSAYGNELTADDVMWRVRRALVNKASGLFMLDSVGATKLSQWRKVDKYTVEITSDKAMPLICSINANEYWTYFDSTEAKKHATEKDPWANDWMGTNSAGFGPYYVDDWKPGQQVVLKANENYWGGRPKISTIHYRVVPEESNRVSLLQSGEVDMIEGLSPDSLTALKDSPGVRPIAVKGNQFSTLLMNNLKAPFDNVKVRQAIEMAIPRDEIVDTVYQGFAIPWQGVTTTTYPGFIEHSDYDYNIDKAKQRLAQAGFPNGFKTRLSYNTNDVVQSNLAVILQGSLRRMGVEVTLAPQPAAAYTDLVLSKKFTLGLWADQSIQPDMNYSMRLYYYKGSFTNYTGFYGPVVQDIIDKCAPVSGDEAITCNQEAVPKIYEGATMGWIAEPDYLFAIRDNIEGFGWWPTQYYRVLDMSFTDAEQ